MKKNEYNRYRSLAARLIIIASFLSILLPAVSHSKVYIDIDAPAGKRLPIAIEDFLVDNRAARDTALADYAVKEINATLAGDFAFTDLFDIIDKEAHLSEHDISLTRTNYRSWRSIGAELLIKGKVKVSGEEITVELRLYDTIKERQITGTRYIGKIINPRLIAHKFADEIMEELTGTRGIFSTRLLFTAVRTGNKEIFMSDYDGKNVRQITHNGSINISPVWSPDGRNIIYTSYKDDCPCLYMREITTGRDRKIAYKPGLNIGGKWSPDGKTIALTLSINKNPELYLLDINTRNFTRLTNNHGIDVSPTWSPDGKLIAYVSDVAGNPHIYVIRSRGGKPKRITYSGKYNATPAWSPNGDHISFTRIDNGNFNIWIMRSDGTDQKQLTFTGNNEDPSWSPDSRHIVFSSSKRMEAATLYMIRPDGTGLKRVPTGLGEEKAPSWSPYM